MLAIPTIVHSWECDLEFHAIVNANPNRICERGFGCVSGGGRGSELGIKVTSPVLAVTLPPPTTAPVLHDRSLLTHLLKQRVLSRCVFVVGYLRFLFVYLIGASRLSLLLLNSQLFLVIETV